MRMEVPQPTKQVTGSMMSQLYSHHVRRAKKPNWRDIQPSPAHRTANGRESHKRMCEFCINAAKLKALSTVCLSIIGNMPTQLSECRIFVCTYRNTLITREKFNVILVHANTCTRSPTFCSSMILVSYRHWFFSQTSEPAAVSGSPVEPVLTPEPPAGLGALSPLIAGEWRGSKKKKKERERGHDGLEEVVMHYTARLSIQ